MLFIDSPFDDLFSLSTLILATASGDGAPHAAPVYFVALQYPEGENPPFRLYFFSESDSRHSYDIGVAGWPAGAIYPDTQDWKEIRGLQMRGRVEPISAGLEWEAVWQEYQHKFPFVKALKEIVAQNTLYGLIPTWVRFVDNRQGFGYKQEWSFLDESA